MNMDFLIYFYFKGYFFVNTRKFSAFDPGDWLFWSKASEIKSWRMGSLPSPENIGVSILLKMAFFSTI